MSSDRAACSALGLLLGGILLVAGLAQAKVFQSQQEALAQAFPDADRIERVSHVLTPVQAEEVEGLSRARLASMVVTIHVGWKGEAPLGYAFIDVHTVRTKPEAVLVVLDPQGSVRSVRILAFHEPLDYLPSDRWYEQFSGRGDDDGLRVGRDIHGVVGATLSARAASDSVRRALAFYRVLVVGSPPT
jgi:transcriptional regulator of nitric oxide reductase